MARFNTHHLAVLKVYVDLRRGEFDEYDYYIYTHSYIARSMRERMPTEMVRRLSRRLRKEGYLKWSPTWSEDDHCFAGSGHYITEKGLSFYNQLIKEGIISG